MMHESSKLRRHVMLIAVFAGVGGLVFLQYASAQYADAKPAKEMETRTMAPIVQIAHGVAPNDVKCKDGMQLVFKSSNNMPACVKPASAQRLVESGWAKSLDMTSPASESIHKIELTAIEEDEVYMWSNADGKNPDLTLVANAENEIQVKNPTDEKHELVIESDGKEIAASGDVDADTTGKLTIKPDTAGTFEYHCEYHPATMKGTIRVTSS